MPRRARRRASLGTFSRGFFLRGIATNLPIISGAAQAWRKRVRVESRSDTTKPKNQRPSVPHVPANRYK